MDPIYPREMHANLVYRAGILTRAERDREFQAALRAMCRKDRLFFFNTFLYTYDPRTAIKDWPFITYPHEDKLILWDAQMAAAGKDNLFEKSRDMGVTFSLAGNDIYDWLFSEERIEIRWGSRKEDYVDKRGDMDSIFEKFRYMLAHLPKWLLPKKFNWNLCDNHMRLINPDTNSIISGEATNSNFGRGGRKCRIRFDEFAFWDCDEEAWAACADATKCRTALSTPQGTSNMFAKLAAGGSENIEKMTLHWTLHPDKTKGAYLLDPATGKKIVLETADEAYEAWRKHRGKKAGGGLKGGVIRSTWYDAECERRTEKKIAEELDIDYYSSGFPFYDSGELDKQKEWSRIVRSDPTAAVPNGKYVTANIIESQYSVKILERPDGWVRIYELPKKQGQYCIGGDTAEGLAKCDKSAAVLKDKWTMAVCAVINGSYPPEDFAYKLWLLSRLYHGCLTVPENNNHGYTTCLNFETLGGNLYYTQASTVAKGSRTAPKRGWTTTPQSRPMMLDVSAENIRQHTTELRDAELIGQCRTFVHNESTGKPEADGEFLDDLVIANAICDAAIRQYPYRPGDFTDKRKQVVEERKRVKNAGYGF